MTTMPTAGPAAPNHAPATRKAMLRLLPVIFFVYFMAYIDRTNVALAKTHLATDVGIGAAAFGLGAGIFFVSYAFLEVPSNLIMYRVGPRRWIARIAVTWGAVTTLMVFVQGPLSFYALRFALGIAEAGLYPALMYMVTIWFAQGHRSTAIGLIYLAPTTALIVGSPIGGGLMELDDLLGLYGWQWLFLVEGLVTIGIGIAVWFRLPGTPSEARWLTTDEAQILAEQAAVTNLHTETRIRGNLRTAFGRPFIVLIALIYFVNQIANIGVVFNIPSIVEDLGVDGSFLIGLVSGTAGIGATIGVLVVPRLIRDRPETEVAAVGVLGLASTVTSIAFMVVPEPAVRILLMSVLMAFVFGTLPLFWSIAMARMSGLMAAAGLAFINTIALIGGFVGPYLFGLVENGTDDPSSGFGVVVAACGIWVLLTPALALALRSEDRVILSRESPAPVLAPVTGH